MEKSRLRTLHLIVNNYAAHKLAGVAHKAWSDTALASLGTADSGRKTASRTSAPAKWTFSVESLDVRPRANTSPCC